MQILFTARDVEVPDEIREYVETKTQKLPRYYDRVHEIEVILGHESDQFSVEVIVRADHRQTFVASEVGPDTRALVDLIVDKLERQLTRHKEKVRNNKHDKHDKHDKFEAPDVLESDE